jgi:hypothetical protein
MVTNQNGPLFRLASKFLKYFLLALFGFAIAYILSVSFNALPMVAGLLLIIGEWFWRLGIALFCLMAIAMVIESFR